jgi:hypothetical protein
MRALYRPALLAVLATIVGVTAVEATAIVDPRAINVAEFRWGTIVEPGLPCPPPSEDPACVPADPATLSIFTLTNIWDGPQPGGTLFDNRLTLPSGEFPLFDLEPGFPFHFDQLAEIGIPAFATTSVSFLYDSALVSLSATLTQPDTFAVLRFSPSQPVPEPGTLALLLAGGTAAAVRRLRRRP